MKLTVIFAKNRVQNPMHALNFPMFTNHRQKFFFIYFQRRNVITRLLRRFFRRGNYSLDRKNTFQSDPIMPLFEGEGFNEKKAQSIATAQVGQIISPEITSAIGTAHNAEYLIQGTIINLGTGSWWYEDLAALSGALNLATSLLNSSIPTGGLGDTLGGIEITKMGIGVQCDVRIIKADTGKVIWNKRVVGVNEQLNLNLGFIVFGNRKMNNNMYTKAMDIAAKKIVDSMIQDMNDGKLFMSL